MNLNDLEFTTSDELLELIRQVNIRYYVPFTANICLLEEKHDKIYFVYLVALKDAYSHLRSVFDYDIQTPQGKKNAQSHLFLSADHLQEGLMDSFRVIVDLEATSLKKSLPESELNAVEVQLAQEIARLRVLNTNNNIDDRIKGYNSLLDYIKKIRKKFSV